MHGEITEQDRERANEYFCSTNGCYHYSVNGYILCHECLGNHIRELGVEDKNLKKLLDEEQK